MTLLTRILNLSLLPLMLSLSAARVHAQPAVTFYEKSEAVPANAKKLKTITLTGINPDRSCSGYELKLDARDSALSIGANLIKTESQRERSREAPCDEITFSFYRVDDLRPAERRFGWSAARPLAWADFKGSVPADAGALTVAETSCGIGVETSTVTSANTPKVYVFNTFQTYTSWVRAADSTADVLEHEQCHWDICELYTRKMRQRFAVASINVSNLQRVVSKIFNETQREYGARQQRYENETRHGTIREQQTRWTQMIADELAALKNI